MRIATSEHYNHARNTDNVRPKITRIYNTCHNGWKTSFSAHFAPSPPLLNVDKTLLHFPTLTGTAERFSKFFFSWGGGGGGGGEAD